MPKALIAYFQGISSLRSASGSLGPGFAASLLAFAVFSLQASPEPEPTARARSAEPRVARRSASGPPSPAPVAFHPADNFDYRPEECLIDRFHRDRNAIVETDDGLQALRALRFGAALVPYAGDGLPEDRRVCLEPELTERGGPQPATKRGLILFVLLGEGGGGLPTGDSFMS